MLLIIITQNVYAPLARHALRLASAACKSGKQVNVFFYQDGANIANALLWQQADELNLQAAWQQLSKQYHVVLPVCVSTALNRGITDAINAKRHQKTIQDAPADNLAEGFHLVGLGELSELIGKAKRVVTL